MKGQTIKKRLQRLRESMKQYGVSACIIPTDDYHGSEYVGAYFQCRAWFSGFTGSAGTLVVTEDMAGLWTDGRYFLQAEQELAGTGIILYRMQEEGVPTIKAFLEEKYAGTNHTIACNGKTISMAADFAMERGFLAKGISFRTDLDLPGEVWNKMAEISPEDKRPALSVRPVWELPVEYAGETRAEKLGRIYEKMKENQADYLLISSLDDIAWLLNLRGHDILYVPVFLAYVLICADKEPYVYLYANADIFPDAIKETLEQERIWIRPYQKIYQELKEVTAQKSVWVDQRATNAALGKSLLESGCRLVKRRLPTQIMKAIKNPIEMENEKKAHLFDGIALCRFLYWLKNKMPDGTTEIEAAQKLESLRARQEGYIESSFAPIFAFGDHGAIVHYEATEESNAVIGRDQFLLFDTGAHYLWGSTDVTRTAAMGLLNTEQKRHYTAVLRGNLALGAAKFKYGCTGMNLDILARQPLWEMGLDFNHGTGHGVGYILNVHEGPNRIAMKTSPSAGSAVMEEGMITSNEPGYYLAGQYGIRLENMILCRKAEKTEDGQFMEFETLTLAPFDRDAILPEEMNKREKLLLNQYHKRVYDEISPYLDPDEREWLMEVTAPLL